MDVLDNKAVVITGAGRGLGRAYALHAAEAGAAIVVNDVDGDEAGRVVAEIRAGGGVALASGHSVVTGADEIVGACVGEFGRIDGLVNNAGLNYQAPSWEDDPARVRELIEVNVLGSLYCGMAAMRPMRAAGCGVIVNIASGSMLGKPKGAAYSASKGAIASLTSSWATDLAPAGIRVNAVSPLAWTRMVEADEVERQRMDPELTPGKLAPLVTYLLSDLSAGITGQLLRFRGDKLHVVRQLAVKNPVLTRDSWTVTDVANAFAGQLRDALEPTPGERWRL